jgi:hypothetical protein
VYVRGMFLLYVLVVAAGIVVALAVAAAGT